MKTMLRNAALALAAATAGLALFAAPAAAGSTTPGGNGTTHTATATSTTGGGYGTGVTATATVRPGSICAKAAVGDIVKVGDKSYKCVQTGANTRNWCLFDGYTTPNCTPYTPPATTKAPTPTPTPAATKSALPVTSSINGGRISGLVVGGVLIVLLGAALVYWVPRRRGIHRA